MAKKILVAYDGTREGHRGLLEFAKTLPQRDVDIHLLAVIRLSAKDVMAETYLPNSVVDDEKQQYESIIQEGRKLIAQRGYQVTTHLEFGEPTEQIVRLANELPAELIVIGHKRRTSLASRWWHNSVGASLLEQSPCSILIAISD